MSSPNRRHLTPDLPAATDVPDLPGADHTHPEEGPTAAGTPQAPDADPSDAGRTEAGPDDPERAASGPAESGPAGSGAAGSPPPDGDRDDG